MGASATTTNPAVNPLNTFTGLIDELTLYNRALTYSEIAMFPQSRQHAIPHVPMHVGQAELPALKAEGELLVIDAEQVQSTWHGKFFSPTSGNLALLDAMVALQRDPPSR